MRSSSSSSNRDERSNNSSAVAGVGSSERKRACDSAFLDPQLLGTELLSIANYSRAMGAAATSSSSYGLAATLHHFSQQQLQQHQQHLQQQQLQLQQQPQVILHTSSAAPVAIPPASPVPAPTQPAPSPSPSPSQPQPPPTTPSPSATAQQLPILLSTLLPLPRQDAQHVSSSGAPVPVPVPVPVRHHLVLSGGARVPTPPDEEAARRRIPIVAWPGVEALAESYKNYSKGATIQFLHSGKKIMLFFRNTIPDCREEKRVLEQRLRELQQEILERRSAVDSLSTRLANLSRLQRFQAGRRAREEAAMRTATEVVAR